MLAAVRLAGSLALHAVIALLLAVLVHRAPVDRAAPPPAALIDIAPSPRRAEPQRVAPQRAAGGAAPLPRHARHVSAPRAPSNGELRIEPVGDGGRGARGAGEGLGLGDGHGFADVIAIGPVAAVPPPPPAPPPPRISKARPARLIYPSRETQVDDAQLFYAEVIVDADGDVAGAKLVRGVSGPRDAEASTLIWRFRYDPARDDDGVPMRSVVTQKFAVAR